MITTYDYHPNGQVKSEAFKIMDSYKGITKSASIEHYSEAGLLMSIEEHDFIEEEQELYDYKYRFFE